MGDTAALVIPRDDENPNTGVGELFEGGKDPVNELRRHPAAIKQVTAMDNGVHLEGTGRLKRPLEIGEKIVTSPAPIDSGAKREVEAQVGVRHEQDPEVRHGHHP